ncbi:GH92 family glycosyl hydrolase [Novosphingobium sp.]|uniref:GH92 family glycosyl hydrolase n=1 Tax=Novosphingobium sp. TaxID=1874826 RepID=UPI00334057AB
MTLAAIGRAALLVLVLALAGTAPAAFARAALPPVAYVDPFIGSDGTGHTTPAATRPFGMVAPGPDNVDHGWEYCSGYQFRAPTIDGFSQTHQSGTGLPEMGDILLMPMAIRRTTGFASHYAKSSEAARAGYYTVRLDDNAVKVELTSTTRVALHRYTFDRPGRVWVLADFQHSLHFLDGPRVTASDVRLGADGADGSVDSTNWAVRHVAFALRFDHPIAASERLPAAPGENAPRYLLAFDLGTGRTLQAKVAVSSTDEAGAQRNLTELPGWQFDAVALASATQWNRLLGRVTIDADARTRRVFTTALYHAFVHPATLSDIDGRYRGADGQIARTRGAVEYSTLSQWDSFRAAQPLYTLIVPERVNDFVLTMLDHARARGYLPIWALWGRETDTMIGDPSLSIIADDWAKGFRGFDGHEALAAMIRTSTVDHAHSQWSMFDQYGYYPFDLVSNEAVSRSLEAGIGDAATARMAAMLGDPAAATRFGTRAAAYRALIDPETHLARGRDSAGHWRTPFDPLTATSPLNNPGDYTEANAWQYSWTPALHDPAGLITAMGGRAAFTAMLDRFFGVTSTKADKYLGQEAMLGQYTHGNEPDQHVPWLYLWSDTPWKAAQTVRTIAAQFYHDTPDGVMGNEDAGQLSAWYVFATLGFYPAQPASGSFVAGVPLVSRATIRVPGRAPLVIARTGTGDLLKTLTYQGRHVDPLALPYRDLARGGTLRFAIAPVMSPDRKGTVR